MEMNEALFDELLARITVLQIAVSELVRALPEDAPSGLAPASPTHHAAASAKRTFAECFRAGISDLMQDQAEVMSPAMDAALTLAVAGILEAAGQPPQT